MCIIDGGAMTSLIIRKHKAKEINEVGRDDKQKHLERF